MSKGVKRSAAIMIRHRFVSFVPRHLGNTCLSTALKFYPFGQIAGPAIQKFNYKLWPFSTSIGISKLCRNGSLSIFLYLSGLDINVVVFHGLKKRSKTKTAGQTQPSLVECLLSIGSFLVKCHQQCQECRYTRL